MNIYFATSQLGKGEFGRCTAFKSLDLTLVYTCCQDVTVPFSVSVDIAVGAYGSNKAVLFRYVLTEKVFYQTKLNVSRYPAETLGSKKKETCLTVFFTLCAYHFAFFFSLPISPLWSFSFILLFKEIFAITTWFNLSGFDFVFSISNRCFLPFLPQK